MTVIEFACPLPPKNLRVNRSRGQHWSMKHKAAGAYSFDVYFGFVDQASELGVSLTAAYRPWARAKVTYTWCYAGRPPDIDNIAGNIKVLQDTLCLAPTKINPSHRLSDRWYLGLITDDQGIEASFKREKVAHRHEEHILVTITRIE